MHAMMYMVRHSTLMPVSTTLIAKSEGIPEGYLAKIFQRLVKAQIVTSHNKNSGGFVFARPPAEISVREVIETIEGKPLFDECFMKHYPCGGTPENCEIYRKWLEATKKLKESLGQISLADVAWTHPEHYFSPSGKPSKSKAGARK